VILAVPAALYYIILIVEKISGRSFSELISSIFKGKQQ
jgi:hypothetical protein